VPPVLKVSVSIVVVRGQKVMLDAELAMLYRVPTKALNQAVQRNLTRFPSDFMFKLTKDESVSLRSQTVTSKSRGGRRHLPLAFTEQGVAMLSSVLRRQRAARVNIEIMRAFVQLRRGVASTELLARKLDALERKYDGQLSTVFEAIRQLMAPTSLPRKRIGFR
jgi:hypothetical protein